MSQIERSEKPQQSGAGSLANEQWTMVRSAIEHEDNLVNHRISWLFAGHAFLFICFAMLQPALLSDKVPTQPGLTIQMGIAVLFLCAAIIALITQRSIAYANIHSKNLRQWWIDRHNAGEWHYQDRSKFRSLIHFFSCGQSNSDFRRVQSSTEQEIDDKSAVSPYPPIKGEFPSRNGSIPAMLAVMDVAILVVCLAIGFPKFVDGMGVTTVKASPSGQSSRQNESGNRGSAEGDSGRTSGAIDIP